MVELLDIIAAFANISLGILVLKKQPHRKEAQVYFVFTLIAVCWIMTNFMWWTTLHYEWLKLTYTTGLLFAFIGTSFFMRRFGLTKSLVIFPSIVALIVCYAWAFHTLWVLFASLVIIKGLGYALHNPCKEIMYIPTSKDIKFKAKSFSGWMRHLCDGLFCRRFAGSADHRRLAAHVHQAGILDGLDLLEHVQVVGEGGGAVRLPVVLRRVDADERFGVGDTDRSAEQEAVGHTEDRRDCSDPDPERDHGDQEHAR